jgi:hypothetical protein
MIDTSFNISCGKSNAHNETETALLKKLEVFSFPAKIVTDYLLVRLIAHLIVRIIVRFSPREIVWIFLKKNCLPMNAGQ